MSIENAYNSWANQYDSNENKTRDLDKKVTSNVLSNYKFSNVLELGCGTGKNTEWLLTKADTIIGFDFSEGMLKSAKEKITSKRVKFIKEDLNKDWKIESELVDLVTSSLTLEHIEDLNHIFNQAYLKLKSTGLFFICELHPFKQYLGSKAKFETEYGTQELETYIHDVSDYINEAKTNEFELVEMKEWFDEYEEHKLPRLISFVFRKE